MMQQMQQMMQNPQFVQQVMESPMMQQFNQQLLNDPEMLRNIISNNPQIRQLMENNPELGHILRDPALLRQALQMSQNPELMRVSLSFPLSLLFSLLFPPYASSSFSSFLPILLFSLIFPLFPPFPSPFSFPCFLLILLFSLLSPPYASCPFSLLSPLPSLFPPSSSLAISTLSECLVFYLSRPNAPIIPTALPLSVNEFTNFK